MASVTFKKELLERELGLPECSLEDVITDTSRWSIHHEIVFEHEGKFYQTYYSEGATEMQCESPWEYDEEIECWEVEQKEVLVKQWVLVGDQ